MRRFRVLLLLALMLGLVPTAPAVALEDAPAAAAWTGDGRVTVWGNNGERLTTVRRLPSFMLDGGLLVGTTPKENIVAFNARTGERRFTIPNGVMPTVLDRRGTVAFWGTRKREKQVNSIWIREIDGDVRKVVQFANGEGLPGYDPGMGGDNGTMSTSFDRTGETMAIAQGNDVSLFVYDVFTVDVESGRVTRITDDLKSRWPSMAPGGRRVAYQRDVKPCDANHIRASRLFVETSKGRNRQRLTGGNCDRWFANARWVTPDSIVAYRTSRVDGELETDLVMINVETRKRRLLTSTRDIVQFSAAEGKVAYGRLGVPGYTILDVTSGDTVVVPRGEFAHITGDRTTL